MAKTRKTTARKVTAKAKTVRKISRTATARKVTPVGLRSHVAPKASEQALTKPEIISELTKSPHGDLEQYLPVGLRASQENADFFGHLVAWNHLKGSIKDAKVALPVIALKTATDPTYRENAAAHLADLDPRLFLRAVDFARTIKAPSRLMRRLVKRYLRDYEAEFGSWERVAVQHRSSLHELYARFAVKPAAFADEGIFKGTDKGKLGVIRKLSKLPPIEAAGLVLKHKIPFLIAKGALGKSLQDPDVLVALIKQMTPAEVVTNTRALEKLGIKTVPAARSAFEEALKRAASSRSTSTALKATVAAEALEDEQLAGKLRLLQEKQLDSLKGIDGNWLVLGDASGSMTAAIESARQVAGTLARMVKGNVYLVFFDSSPRFFDVTGKTLTEITAITKGVSAGGQTSIGCGLQAILEKGLQVDGIAVITDGGENCQPYFYDVYKKYAAKFGIEPTVYCYKVADLGYSTAFETYCKSSHIDVQLVEIKTSDYYSLPNVVQTMRVGRYSLLDEVLNVSLKTVDDVLTNTKGMEVVPHVSSEHAQTV